MPLIPAGGGYCEVHESDCGRNAIDADAFGLQDLYDVDCQLLRIGGGRPRSGSVKYNLLVRIVYVASLLTFDGIEHIGRSLARHFQTEHQLRVVGAIAPADSELHNTRVSDRVLQADDLNDVDVVYMEGGWTDGTGGATERFPLAVAEAFVRRGGLLIVADVDRNAAVRQRNSLHEAARMFGAHVAENAPMGDAICYLHDARSEERSGTRFLTSEMTVSDRTAPALNGVDSLLAAGTVALTPMGADIAASGNRSSTQVLASDFWVDLEGVVPWATVNECGDGHAVLIGGWVSADTNIEDCPDNARWISNIVTTLTDRTRETQQWSARLPSSPRGANLALEALLAEPESERLERKSSFLVPSDPTRPVDREKIQHAVGKSIAALANSGGGHVVIGQADDKSVLGLAVDFAALGSSSDDRDGFTQALIRYTDKNVVPRYEILGLKVHWLNHLGLDVAIVEVPRQPSHTTVTVKHWKTATPEVYVRRGTQSDPIADQALYSWIHSRK